MLTLNKFEQQQQKFSEKNLSNRGMKINSRWQRNEKCLKKFYSNRYEGYRV